MNRDFKFGIGLYRLIVASPSYKTTNLPELRHVTYFNFRCPIHISGMGEARPYARAVKFCTDIE